jgi:hypothetical protein
MCRRYLYYLLLLLILEFFFHANGQGCITGYTYHATLNTCLKYVVSTTLAGTARTLCVSSGGDLISVPSLAIHNYVSSTFATTVNVIIGLYHDGTQWTW